MAQYMIEMTNTSAIVFMRARKALVAWGGEKSKVNLKKLRTLKKFIFKALIWLRRVPEQQRYLWKIFYQMGFMKR